MKPAAWWLFRVLSAIPVVALCLPLASLAGEATLVLPARRATSAGVCDASGNLVRTLWRGRPHAGGPITVAWDGMDDDGHSVTPGSYSVRVLGHDVRYTWEGVIANTSAEATGPSVYRALNVINDMAIDRHGNAFFALGYNEREAALNKFVVDRPQVRVPLARDDYRRIFRHVATDGDLVYFANAGVVTPKGAQNRDAETFVVALNVLDGREHVFKNGRTVYYRKPEDNRWESVVDYDNDDTDDGSAFRSAPGALAVQRMGNILFVAHPGTGEIRMLDKRDGALLGRAAIADVIALAIARDDSLWILQRGKRDISIARYRVENGKLDRVAEVTDPLEDPKALGVSPVDDTLIVIDAGSEQLKVFDRNGAPKWTHGVSGGYRTGPDVTPERFWFSAGPTYVAFQADGSFWVGDPGNFRNLHFDPNRRYLDQIAYLPATYTATVDANDPTRVFTRFLEFRVGYTGALRESWTLVRNWAGRLPKRYFGFADGIRFATTLGNGRTYAMIGRHGEYETETKEIVELSEAGTRLTGLTLDPGVRLYGNGALRRHELKGDSVVISEKALDRFDQAGNPQWSGWRRIAAARAVENVDPYYQKVPLILAMNEATYPETEDGVIVSFTPGHSLGFHLGGILRGGTQWRWRASPTGHWNVDEHGIIVAPDGIYGLDKNVQYPGNTVMVSGNNVIYGYHGEGWNQGQANQWVHYASDGLFVGEFGTPSYPHIEARAGSAGNAFAAALVRIGDRLYLWHNDESIHGGVHRWRIDGLNSIVRVSAPIAP